MRTIVGFCKALSKSVCGSNVGDVVEHMVEKMNVSLSLSGAETKQAALCSLPITCSVGTNRFYRSHFRADVCSLTQ
jgi:hypothetical protein